MHGNPNDKDFDGMVHSGMLSCPFTKKYFYNAKHFFRINLPAVIGKTVRKKPVRFESNYFSILADLIAQHCNVTLNMDIMFVNWPAILVTHG